MKNLILLICFFSAICFTTIHADFNEEEIKKYGPFPDDYIKYNPGTIEYLRKKCGPQTGFEDEFKCYKFCECVNKILDGTAFYGECEVNCNENIKYPDQ